MLELVIIWAVSLVGLGIGVLLTAMFVRYVLTNVGRVVFFTHKKTDDTIDDTMSASAA